MPQRSDDRITSRQNRWFRRFQEAAESHREEIVLEGPKQIRDAIGLGWKPIAFGLATEGEAPREEGIPALAFSAALMHELTDTRHPQGVLALFERPHASLDDVFIGSDSLIVVLDGVQDPGNVGTIVRLAAAFNASGVVLTEGSADPYAPKALRAAAGTSLLLPLVRSSRREIIDALRKREIPLLAAIAGAGGNRSLVRPAALAFGSEGRGVSEELAAAAIPVSIPISARVESLNVAAAAAILLHELRPA